MKILTPLCLCIISALLSYNSFAIDVEATFAELDNNDELLSA